MEWVERFYARQHSWLASLGMDESEIEGERMAAVLRVCPPPARVLELGAGTGADAAALANAGYEVVAVELIPEAALRAGARRVDGPGSLSVVPADLYTADIGGPFGVVVYWDGFGLGSDADQRRLLARVRDWLDPDGAALVEAYTPWYWAETAGREMVFGPVRRRYGIDGAGCRMLDTWWEEGDEASAVTQSLRCYSPADLALLTEPVGLRVERVEPTGRYDAETGAFDQEAPLHRAMGFVTTLRRG